MASTDRAVLLALFRSTRGSGWKNSNNWNTSAPLSEWYGVRVDGEGRVVGLFLQDNNLQGTIPRELGTLATLQKLNLSKNGLTGSIPEELGELVKLEELVLYENKLSGGIPTELGRLVTLRLLYLHGNGLTGSIPKELGGLVNLEDLRLSDNELIGEIPTELGRLVTLRILYVYGNGLTGSIPGELGELVRLEQLRLDLNKLTGGIPTELGRLVTLRTLYLHGNGLTGSIPKELGGLVELDDLRLSDNELIGGIPTELGRLVTLRTLYLDGNGLTGSIPKELGGLVELDDLRLSDNELIGSIPKELGGLDKLEVLRLDLNKFTGSIPTELGDLVKLETLRLEDNKLTGVIPPELGRLGTLTTLHLGGNGLTGSIPEELGGLTKLEGLWLGGNKLSGSVPKSLLEHPRRKDGGMFMFHITEDGAPVPAYKSWKGVAIQLVLGYADIGTDVLAVVSYYKAHHMWWFALGLIFIIGPALFAAIVLLRREIWLRRVFVALHLGMLFEALVSWNNSTYSPTLASLRMMEPLYESVPQLMLQLYGLLLEWDSGGAQWLPTRLLSIVFSCFSLAYATTGLVAEQPLSRLSPTAGASSACCPSLTGLLFGAVPANASVAVYRSRWNAQNFIWAFLFYQALEIGARFISLALLALVWRAYFFLALLWLLGSRAYILRRLLGEEELLRVRSQFRLVGMPFMDSVMDTLSSYDAGCALTLLEFVFCLTIGNMFYTDEGSQLPASTGRVWTYVAVVFMAGKLCLGYLIVRPFKRVVHFGTEEEEEEQTSGRQHGGVDGGGNEDVDPCGSSRADDRGMLGGKRERTHDGDESNRVVRALAGPERRRGARVHEGVPFSATEQRGALSWSAREGSEGASRVGGLNRWGEPGSAPSSAGLEMMAGMEEGKVASEIAPFEGTDLEPVAHALSTGATRSGNEGSSRVFGLDRRGEPGSADSSAVLEMMTGVEEGRVASDVAPPESTELEPVAHALSTGATKSCNEGASRVGGLDRRGGPGSADSSEGLEMVTGMKEGKGVSEVIAPSEGRDLGPVAHALTTVVAGSGGEAVSPVAGHDKQGKPGSEDF